MVTNKTKDSNHGYARKAQMRLLDPNLQSIRQPHHIARPELPSPAIVFLPVDQNTTFSQNRLRVSPGRRHIDGLQELTEGDVFGPKVKDHGP